MFPGEADAVSSIIGNLLGECLPYRDGARPATEYYFAVPCDSFLWPRWHDSLIQDPGDPVWSFVYQAEATLCA